MDTIIQRHGIYYKETTDFNPFITWLHFTGYNPPKTP